MKRFLNKKTILLTAAATVMTVSLTVGSAMAYFTTYTSASGSATLSLGTTTTIREEFANWTKHIMIDNVGDNECYIRVKAFAGSQYTLNYAGAKGAWAEGEGDYWYYNSIVPAGGSTGTLDVSITVPVDPEDPKGEEELKQSFNVVVIQECTPVLYDDNGEPYADWSITYDNTTGIRGEGAGE